MSKTQDSFSPIEIEKFLLKTRNFKTLKRATLLEQFASRELAEKLFKYCLKQKYISFERDNSRNFVYFLSAKGKAWLEARGKAEKPKKELFKPSRRLNNCIVYHVDPKLLQMGIPVESIIK